MNLNECVSGKCFLPFRCTWQSCAQTTSCGANMPNWRRPSSNVQSPKFVVTGLSLMFIVTIRYGSSRLNISSASMNSCANHPPSIMRSVALGSLRLSSPASIILLLGYLPPWIKHKNIVLIESNRTNYTLDFFCFHTRLNSFFRLCLKRKKRLTFCDFSFL